MNETILQLAGRLHPVLLHLPIGVMATVVVVELWGWLRRRPPERGTRLLLAWLLAASAGLSIGSGILLGEEPTYVGDAVEVHRWLAICTGVAMLAAAVFATIGAPRGYAAALFAAVILIVPTGHYGAGMTHGEDFFTAPFTGGDAVLATDHAAGSSWYATEIAPILEAHCTGCHGPTRRKAGLALHDAGAIRAGSRHGSVLVAETRGPGPLLRRIRVPLADDDHMPPEGKPQLSSAQIETLSRWIEAGAPFDAAASDAPAAPAAVRRELPVEAVADLQAAYVHVEVIDPEASLLWIDFTAAAEMELEDAVRLLAPLAPSTEELSLRGVAAANEILVLCAPWGALRRLDLSSTSVDRDGLAAASGAGALVELTLVGSALTPEAAGALAGLASLEQMHVWKAGLPDDVLASLRARPTLVVNDGSVDAPAPLAVEPEFELAAAPVVAASLEPVNTTCPVTGAPVDPAFAIVHEGQVVGFCCKNCPGRFWEDPDKYPVVADAAKGPTP